MGDLQETQKRCSCGGRQTWETAALHNRAAAPSFAARYDDGMAQVETETAGGGEAVAPRVEKPETPCGKSPGGALGSCLGTAHSASPPKGASEQIRHVAQICALEGPGLCRQTSPDPLEQAGECCREYRRLIQAVQS